MQFCVLFIIKLLQYIIECHHWLAAVGKRHCYGMFHLSSLICVVAFEVILIGARQVVGGSRRLRARGPANRSYMDYITGLAPE